jgi:D-alanyl-D-alanine carboxypeptidase
MKNKFLPLFAGLLLVISNTINGYAQIPDYPPITFSYSGKFGVSYLNEPRYTKGNHQLSLTPELELQLHNILEHNVEEDISVSIIFPNGETWEGVKGHSQGTALINSNTQFSMGSVNKTFVASVFLKMQEEGKLSLDDSIYRYLKPLRNVDSCITIRMLLNHSSGLSDIIGMDNYYSAIAKYPNHVWTGDSLIRKFMGSPLRKPGLGDTYCNTNYILAGMILNKITGHSVSSVLHEYILDSLNLGRTLMYPDAYDSADFCREGNGVLLNSTAGLSSIGAAGAIISTAHDLASWAKILYSGKYLSDTSFQQMKVCHTINGGTYWKYGLGFTLLNYPKNNKTIDIYGHFGQWANYGMMFYIPQDSLSITLCFIKPVKDQYCLFDGLYNAIAGIPGPINDNIENAIELEAGLNGPFTNRDASIEINEPEPPMKSCNSQMDWCPSDPIQNTLWFWFNAPESGIVSFTANGFDNQLAVYDAQCSDSILAGNYRILAANDNANGVYPVIFNLKDLVPQKKYYLQLSGYGANSGVFSINYLTNDQDIVLNKQEINLDTSIGSFDSLKITASFPWSISGVPNWLRCSLLKGTSSKSIKIETTSATKTQRTAILKVQLLNFTTREVMVTQSPGDFTQTTTSDISVAPNPVDQKLKIAINNNDHMSYSIYSIEGKIILSGTMHSEFNELDVSNLSKGQYFLRITDAKDSFVYKFIKN